VIVQGGIAVDVAAAVGVGELGGFDVAVGCVCGVALATVPRVALGVATAAVAVAGGLAEGVGAAALSLEPHPEATTKAATHHHQLLHTIGSPLPTRPISQSPQGGSTSSPLGSRARGMH